MQSIVADTQHELEFITVVLPVTVLPHSVKLSVHEKAIEIRVRYRMQRSLDASADITPQRVCWFGMTKNSSMLLMQPQAMAMTHLKTSSDVLCRIQMASKARNWEMQQCFSGRGNQAAAVIMKHVCC